MITGMDHVGISVTSMERAIGFYRDVLGMDVLFRGRFGKEWHEPNEYEQRRAILGLKEAEGEVALLRLGGMQIELFEFTSPRPKPVDPNRPVCDHGITHICLAVTDTQAVYARLKAAGVAFHCEPQFFPGQALVTYGRDPDGNVFELLEWIKAEETAVKGSV